MATLARCKSYLDCANTHIVGVLDWCCESKSDRVLTCKDGLEMAVFEEVGAEIGRVVRDMIFFCMILSMFVGDAVPSLSK